jgi:Txe/YoeB family toxin of Txe-Axe toxin-antitoxin module
MTSQKVNNFTTNDLNDHEVYEIPNIELKSMMLRMINKIKEDMYKHLSKFKENTHKQLDKFK